MTPEQFERAEGKYRVRFVKPASSMSVEPRGVTNARVGEEWTLFWRPSRQAEGDRCYEHYEHEPIQPDDHSPRAEEVRELIRASADANRHPGSWWTSYDVDGAAIFNDCQVEVVAGPLEQR
jgi:hypothetical protein